MNSYNTEKFLRSTLLSFIAVVAACSMLALYSCTESSDKNNDNSNEESSISSNVDEKKSILIEIHSVADSDTVFICTGKASKRFHASDTCEGIMQCTKKIIPLMRVDAEKRHRTFCHKCYRDSLEEE